MINCSYREGPNGLTCSGRGNCVCGLCNCEKFDVRSNIDFLIKYEQDGRAFFGVSCECDNFQCDSDPSTGLLCGGNNYNTSFFYYNKNHYMIASYRS